LSITAWPVWRDPLTKSGREVVEILQAFDLTQCPHSAAKLAGVDEKNVARYVAIRDAGNLGPASEPRPAELAGPD
jgi:hypothetical protein